MFKRVRPVVSVMSPERETAWPLTSSDFERVKPILRRAANDGRWTGDKNRCRVELIDKKIARTITQVEFVELADLQQQAESHFDQLAPPPMKGVVELHQQLSNRDSQ